MKNFTCLFTVTTNDDFDDRIARGVVYANTFTDAMKQIETLFGTSLIKINEMELYDVSLLLVSEETYNKIKEEI